jgi:sensor c-di-GMP phosphodiesterase-like protein
MPDVQRDTERLKTVGTIGGIVVVALLLALLPVVAAYQLSRSQTLDIQSQELGRLASDLIRRANETGDQLRNARDQLNSGKFGPPGSPSEIERMRYLSLTSTYLQAVGRMTGTKVISTSMGLLQPPVDLGKPDITTVRNVHIWLYTKPQFAGGAEFHALEADGCVVLIAPDLMFDVFSNESRLSMAIVTGKERRALTVHGAIDKSWLDRLGSDKAATFVDAGRIVALRRSDSFDVVAVVAQPVDQASRRLAAALFILVPIGALVGIAASFVGVRAINRLRSLPFQLHAALRKREFYLLFQPVVNLSTGQIVGAEALIRWRRGNGQIVPPDQFIPAAEKMNLIGRITSQVVEMSFVAAKQALTVSPSFYVGLNVSSSDVRSGVLPDMLQGAAIEHGVPLEHIGVEITETGLLSSASDLSAFEAIRATGVKIAMDDFGTGYSSLAYLMRLDVDALKIDKIFVDAIGTDSATSNVIDHMIRMAAQLKKTVIAEGVETEIQANYLRDHGVQLGQGYYFAKPIPLKDLLGRLKGN